jgi:anti-sigma B factor antagonist
MVENMRDESLTVKVDDDGTIVVCGDIDMASGPQLEAAVLAQEDSQPLVIDVRGVDFIDSSGLRVLFDANRRATERGTRLVLQAVGDEVMRLLQITGTTDQFVIE